MHLSTQRAAALVDLARIERRAFAAKIRVVRALLGWSQSELALRAGLTQRAIHKLEQGDTEPRHLTARVLEAIWQEEGIAFERTEEGFRLVVADAVLDRSSDDATETTTRKS